MLLSYFIRKDISLDLFGDIPLFSIKGSVFQQGESIGEGFRLGKFQVFPGKKEDILDIRILVPIYDEKSDKLVRKISLRLGSYYDVSFYEGALELSQKNTNRTSGIVLEGDSICSVLKLTSVQEKDDVQIYKVTTNSGKFVSQVVSLDKIL